MTCTRTLLAILVAAAGTLIGSSSAQAVSDHHIDVYALRLERQADRLMVELQRRYRHVDGFGHLLADARRVQRGAAHVHEVAHAGRDLVHLQRDLRELDEAVHHLDELMRGVEQRVCHCRDRHCGHFHGDPRPARRLIDQMLDTLHHLQEDVRVALRGCHVRARVGHGSPRGFRYGPAGAYYVTFGHRGWTVRLGSWF
ncbi:MAG: hypothetical protein GTO03_00800 [Planctomycetales bacterium]|nr:hypothetical protein [Planctomycetales bacterium]